MEDFSAKLHEIFDLGYDGVIAVMLSSGLSGTYNLARIVAEECREQGRAMVAFDSLSGSLGLGMTVLQLAEDIRNGMGWEELTERRVPQLIQNTYPFFTLDTLEYLQKGGRIVKVTALAGTMLQIKPVLTFADDGQLQSIAKVRGLAGGNGDGAPPADRGSAPWGASLGRRDRRHAQRLHRRRRAGRCGAGAGLNGRLARRGDRPLKKYCKWRKFRV